MLLKFDDDDDVFSCSPKKANTEEKKHLKENSEPTVLTCYKM